MTKYIPPGFDRNRVIDGLHKAMGFGEPTRVEDKATFFFATRSPVSAPKDGAGVPFDGAVRPTNVASPKSMQVTCSVEYFDRSQAVEQAGEIRPTRIKITLLDPEYQQVKNFRFVVCGGDKYMRDTVQPPDALASLDVWAVWCTAEGES